MKIPMAFWDPCWGPPILGKIPAGPQDCLESFACDACLACAEKESPAHVAERLTGTKQWPWHLAGGVGEEHWNLNLQQSSTGKKFPELQITAAAQQRVADLVRNPIVIALPHFWHGKKN